MFKTQEAEHRLRKLTPRGDLEDLFLPTFEAIGLGLRVWG